MRTFLHLLRPTLVSFALLTLLTGVAYTGLVTGVAQLAYPHEANGSIMSVTLKDGTKAAIGSELLGQSFADPRYLIGRPVQAASNLSATGKEQEAAVAERVARWQALDPGNKAAIPQDLVTVSGSGVDPRISPAAADYQVARIARVRGIAEDDVRRMIERHTTERFLGFWGEPAVNVLRVNAELDGLTR
ncbi:potassium-transporting ATPase subunit C [Gorillibacterium sp. CAU 1737]|uniref:potassium-transporting ATPase subunit C n=1 Tax=Gorillibacterium sp. CAU 1737 TaxID=3140362 RepID=UPI003260611B